jgi:hypothetical protein
MKIKKYFSYSPFEEFNFYDKPEDAKASADTMLVAAREHAEGNGEWDDEDSCIFWGEVKQSVFEIKGNPVNSYGDCETDFELRDVVVAKMEIPTDFITAEIQQNGRN